MKYYFSLVTLYVIVTLNLCTSAIIFPSFTGNYIYDAYGPGNSSMNNLAKQWVINGIPNQSQTKTSMCDYALIGGIDVSLAGSSLSRTYDSLPTHGILFYAIKTTTIDNWQAGQKVYLSFDNKIQFSYEPVVFTELEGTAKCGNLTKDVQLIVVGSVYHSASQLRISITSNPPSSLASYGITDFKVRLAQKKTEDIESSCLSVNNAISLTHSGVCQCAANQYYDTTSQTCVNCDDSCERCFGSSPGKCYVCKDGYTYDINTDQCVACGDDDCLTCSGTGTNKCNMCSTKMLQPDNTCQNTCASPLTSQNFDFPFCDCLRTTFLDNGACNNCGSGCDYCTDADTCIVCQSQFMLSDGKCVCPGGKYGSGCTEDCVIGCELCSDSITCTKYIPYSSEYPGFTKYNQTDSYGGDIGVFPIANFTTIALRCTGSKDCLAFNDAGWLKNVVLPQSQWGPYAGYVYVKNGSYTELNGYVFHKGKDSLYAANLSIVADIGDLWQMKALCDNDPSCSGFSTDGYFKGTLGPESSWVSNSIAAPDYGLYVKGVTQTQCPEKTYMDSNGKCQSCMTGCDSCTSSGCSACTAGTTEYTDGYCKCDVPGFYYDSDQQACIKACPSNCEYCRDGTTCQECRDGLVWQNSECQCPSSKILVGTTCECPFGTAENPETSLCESLEFLNIISQSEISPYAPLVIQGEMAPEIEASFSPVFSWTVTSTTATPSIVASLQEYLTTQTAKIVMVPASYLESGVDYVFIASYTNSQGVSLTKSVAVQTSSQAVQLNIKGGAMQTLNYSIGNTIAVEVNSASGLVPSSLLDITWTKNSVDSLNLAALVDSQAPFLLSIPRCTFLIGKSYNFTITAKQKGSGIIASTAKIDITSPRPKLIITIPDANRGHKATQDLIIQPVLTLEDPCNLTDINSIMNLTSRRYELECSKINSDGISYSCSDPDGIFSTPLSSSSVTIPSYYFAQDIGIELSITVKATVWPLDSSDLNVFSASAHTSLTLHPADSKAVSLYSITATTPTIYEVAFEDSAQNDYKYSWEFSPQVDYVYFENQLKVLTDLQTLSTLDPPYIRAKMAAIDGSDTTTSLYYQLPINQAPKSGSAFISPTIGISLVTDFFISTSGWIEEDIPLTFEFLYSSNETEGYKSLTSTQLSNYVFTPLVSRPPSSSVYVKVIVRDKFEISSQRVESISVEPPTNLEQVIERIQELFSRKKDVTPVELTSYMTLSTDSLELFEQNSLEQTQINAIIDTKISTLSAMDPIIYKISPDPTMRQVAGQNIESLSSSVASNNVQSLTLMENIIESLLGLKNSEIVLSLTESTSVSNFLSNLFSYAGLTDPNIDGQFSKDLEEKMYQYLMAVSDSMLSNKFPGEEPIIINTANFGMYTAKSTPCLLNSSDLVIGPDYPTIQLSMKDPTKLTPADCATLVDIKYFAVKSDIFNVSSSSNTSNTTNSSNSTNTTNTTNTTSTANIIIALDVRNSKTLKPLEGVSATVIPPAGNQQCPVDCDKVGTGCECIDMFDIKAQFAKIFRKSNLGKLGDISALIGFKFWESLAVWCAIAFTTWFFVSLYFVKIRKPHYNVADNIKLMRSSTKHKIKQSKVLFLIAHPILQIYFYKNDEMSKVTKLILYYQQLIFLLAYAALFPTASEENQIISKIILILFKSVTITPATIIITTLIKDLDPNSKAKMTWFRRNKRKIGIILSAIATLGCLYIIIVVSASTASESQTDWTINFLVVLIQGIFVSPPVALFVQVVLILYMTSRVFQKIPIVKIIIPKIINKDVEKVYSRIWFNGNGPLRLDTVSSPRENAYLKAYSQSATPSSRNSRNLGSEREQDQESPLKIEEIIVKDSKDATIKELMIHQGMEAPNNQSAGLNGGETIIGFSPRNEMQS